MSLQIYIYICVCVCVCVCVCKQDLALNNVQWLICHKTQPAKPTLKLVIRYLPLKIRTTDTQNSLRRNLFSQ